MTGSQTTQTPLWSISDTAVSPDDQVSPDAQIHARKLGPENAVSPPPKAYDDALLLVMAAKRNHVGVVEVDSKRLTFWHRERPVGGYINGAISLNAAIAKDLVSKPAALVAALNSQGVPVVEQDSFEALEIDLYVIGDKVVGGVVMVLGSVVGNGIQTVAELIAEDAHRRSQHSLLRPYAQVFSSVSPVDPVREIGPVWHDSVERSLSDVPTTGEWVALGSSRSLAAGAIPVDVFDELSAEICQLAADAVWSLPGLRAGVVRVAAERLDSRAGKVVGVYADASIMPFHYPVGGKPRQLAGGMMNKMMELSRSV